MKKLLIQFSFAFIGAVVGYCISYLIPRLFYWTGEDMMGMLFIWPTFILIGMFFGIVLSRKFIK